MVDQSLHLHLAEQGNHCFLSALRHPVHIIHIHLILKLFVAVKLKHHAAMSSNHINPLVNAIATKHHLPVPLLGLELLDLPYRLVVPLPLLVPSLPEDLSVPLDPTKIFNSLFYMA